MNETEEKELIIELINSIRVNNANLDYISKTGIVNGSLWLEIERILKKYATEVSRGKDKKIVQLVKQKRALENILSEKSKAIRTDQSRGS